MFSDLQVQFPITMKSTLKFLHRLQHKIIHSIAFYPVLISFVFVLIALGLLFVEQAEGVEFIKENVAFLIVKEQETARTILSTIFGGILSLTVFSFTMVMVVLNQASSNFSPRLLPGLISARKHQSILGVYIGTLLFSLILLMVLGSYGPDTNAIGLSVMVAAALGIICLALFVSFIHNISQSIQIHNIINKIYHTTDQLLDKSRDLQRETNSQYGQINTEGWHIINCEKTGYYRSFDASLITKELFKDKPLEILVIPHPDAHIWEGQPLYKVKYSLTEEQQENLQLCTYILSNQHEDDSSVGGMIKLSEVAVRALSPGVNDPGTAINTVSKLGQLIEKTLSLNSLVQLKAEQDSWRIYQSLISAEELMRIIIEPIRQYGKRDSALSHMLMKALLHISNSSSVLPVHVPAVRKEVNRLCQDVEQYMENKEDIDRVLELNPAYKTTKAK